MTAMKTVGIVAASVAATALVGGGAYWLYHRRQKKKEQAEAKEAEADDPTAPRRDADGEPVDQNARGHIKTRADIPPDAKKLFTEMFGGFAPPKDEVIDNLTQEDVVVFAVESEPVPGYEEIREEVITAKVRTVERSVVRARVADPVAYAEHHGSHAGHGFRVGDLVEVPRGKILIAARPKPIDREGYGSQGAPANTFKPTNVTKKTYQVRPGTPYDLVMPYRTEDIEWFVDEELVKFERVGHKALLEQIVFSEDSMRGPVTIRALDRDPKAGLVFVARWEFTIDP